MQFLILQELEIIICIALPKHLQEKKVKGHSISVKTLVRTIWRNHTPIIFLKVRLIQIHSHAWDFNIKKFPRSYSGSNYRLQQNVYHGPQKRGIFSSLATPIGYCYEAIVKLEIFNQYIFKAIESTFHSKKLQYKVSEIQSS